LEAAVPEVGHVAGGLVVPAGGVVHDGVDAHFDGRG
jgi:hypothetical protein